MPDDNAPVVKSDDDEDEMPEGLARPDGDEDEMPEGPARPEGGSGMDPLTGGSDDGLGSGPGEIKSGGQG